MARKFKFHKGLRANKAKATQAEKPTNLREPGRKMSPAELEREFQRKVQAGIKGKSTHQARKQELTRRDRKGQW